MKISTAILYSCIAMLTIFSSCKKEEEKTDLCSNGFLDPGETSPDCGGNCPPCNTTPASYLGLKVNGVQTLILSKSLNYDGTNWVLSISNDSLSLNINLGSTGATGSFPISSNLTSATYNGNSYPDLHDAHYVISAHDTGDDLMSGYFYAKFSRPGFTDTLRITDGTFEYMPY